MKNYQYNECEIVKINIGGTHHIATKLDVLRSDPESRLAKYISDKNNINMLGDEIFIDRDGNSFLALVNYLRNDRKMIPEFGDINMESNFYIELNYWGID